MELDITHMVNDADGMPLLSGSVAELGNSASRITWANSVAYGQSQPLLRTDDERDAARQHFREYGAWSAAEIAAWSEDDLQAMMCQDVAAAIREREAFDTDEEFQQACENGQASSRIYCGDDGRWYFYLGI
jgi:hypothetical protein